MTHVEDLWDCARLIEVAIDRNTEQFKRIAEALEKLASCTFNDQIVTTKV